VSLRIDHVVLCVPDLDRAGKYLSQRYGLLSHPGGRHPGQGTANRIVPLGESYLELVAVVDPVEAVGSTFGSWVADNASHPPSPRAVCLRTDDLDEVCARLGLEATSMSRETPDGSILRWRLAGLDQALAEALPFFLQWEVPDDQFPGRMQPGNAAHIDEVIMSGDVDRLREWTAGVGGLVVESGAAGIEWVGLETG
jgi:hypothetical protein